MGTLRRISAFTTRPDGGNPAGVWVGDELPDTAQMQSIAGQVGYSETAFAAPSTGPHRTVRYYSPVAEVPFCGHATIALGRALADAEGQGSYQLATPAGMVGLDVGVVDGHPSATLTSVEPSHRDATPVLVGRVLELLRWDRADLDHAHPPAVAFAGAHHLILFAGSRERLAHLDYDFDGLAAVMLEHDLTTVALVWLERDGVVHARNPFPVGGVVEDPATGAAAAALGGLLRARSMIAVPADVTIHQGVDMGRPSLLLVGIPATGGIRVTGTAVDIPTDAAVDTAT